MVNFVVLNESPFEINDIDVTYVDEQSMNDQHADASGVTVLSDGDIPNGTAVSVVSVEGVEIAEEPTPVELPSGNTIIASLVYYINPKSGQADIIGVEMQQDLEG
jgi:archaellum component FlaG (FlaF/FlaG flagellin family)